MRILLIGPPGVGKGTQAALLTQRTGALHLASGDIFRAELKAQTDLGRLARSYLDAGELVPDDVTVEMMSRRLASQDVRERGFVLDGFPRTLAQAEALTRILTEAGISLDKVVTLEVPDDVVVERIAGRLSCPECGAIYHRVSNPPKAEGRCDRCGSSLIQRPDDRPEVVRERLRVFHEATRPVVSYYEAKGDLLRVDGSGNPEEVFEAIMEGLSK